MSEWIVGLDLRPEGEGAIRFAQWLAAANGDGAPLLGVHVVETHEYPHPPEDADIGQIGDYLRPIAEEVVATAGASEAFDRCEVRAGPAAEAVLPEVCKEVGARGVVIGRRGRQQVQSIVRLGRVARRLLRSLPVPVVVVRPELRTEDIGAGPVVVATDLAPDSDAACRFAAAVARDTGRPLTVVHVMTPSDEPRVAYVREALRDSGWLETTESKRRELDRWVAARGLDGAEVRIERGDAVDRLLELAEKLDAALVVTGSRKLGITERVFGSSVASALAAMGSCPVAVVPPDAP